MPKNPHNTIYLILLSIIVILTLVNISQSLEIADIDRQVTGLQLINTEQEAFIRHQREINIELQDKMIDIIGRFP